MRTFYLAFRNWQTLSAKLRWRDGLITEGRKVNIMCNRGDNLHANCIQIARKNQHLQMIVRENREAEPQINADERRFVNRDFQQYSKDRKPQSSDSKLLALKHKNETQNSTRMTWIKRMFTDPCKSAPSAKSAFYRHTDPRTKSTDGKVSGFICVHPRFFYDVTFQTGSTGWTVYYINSVSNLEEPGI
jgi:hypothetical protein